MISFLFPFHSRAAHDYTRDTTKKKKDSKKKICIGLMMIQKKKIERKIIN